MKKLLIVLFAAVMLFALVGCNNTTTPSATVAPTQAASVAPTQAASPTVAPPAPITIKYNELEKDSHPQGVTMHAFATKVAELSGGLITVETYASGALFNQDAEVTAVMSGDLDMTNIAFSDIATYLPSAGMFAAPYAMTGYAHMDKVFTSDAVKAWYAKVMAACHYMPIGYMTQGSRLINTKATAPVMTPENMKGVNLRMPSGATWEAIGKSLGANVVPIAYAEVYTALQTGVCDAQDNPWAGTVASKFYEVTKQISLTNHVVDVKLIVVSEKLWNSLNDQQKKWMNEAASYAGKQGSQATYDSEAANKKVCTDAGLTVTTPDINAFQTYSHQYYVDNGLTKTWDNDLYNAIQALK